MTIITFPTRQAQAAEALLDAASEWEHTQARITALHAQLEVLEARRRFLAAAAAARVVRTEHPTAERIIFAVRDGRPHGLYQVRDAEGLYLSARRTGAWAEEVLSTVIGEDLQGLAGERGVSVTRESLSIDITLVESSLAGEGCAAATGEAA